MSFYEKDEVKYASECALMWILRICMPQFILCPLRVRNTLTGWIDMIQKFSALLILKRSWIYGWIIKAHQIQNLWKTCSNRCSTNPMGEQRCSLFKRWNVRPEDNVPATFSKAYKNTSLSARAQAVAEAERASVKTWAACPGLGQG